MCQWLLRLEKRLIQQPSRSESAQPHFCWSHSSKAERVLPTDMHTNTFLKHKCVHTAGHADQHRQELSTYTNSTSGLSLLPSPVEQNSPSMSNTKKYVQDGCIRPPVAGLRQSVFLVADSGSSDFRFCQLLAPRGKNPLQGHSPTPFAHENISFKDFLINIFIYAIRSSLTEDKNFQLSHKS